MGSGQAAGGSAMTEYLYRGLLTAVVLVAVAPDVLAEGVYRDGVGARAVGRGSINLGFADTGEMLLDNPAAMTNLPGSSLQSFGADLLITNLTWQEPGIGSFDGHDNPFPMGQAAFITRSDDGRLAVGVGVFSQAGMSSNYDLPGPIPLVGQRNYKSLGALAKILPGVAFRVTDDLTVGATLGVAVSHIELEAPYFLQGPNPFVGTPTMLDMQSTGAALAWSLGLQYDLSDCTRLGITYTGETRFSMHGNTRVEIPGVGNARFSSDLDVDWPRMLGIGISHQLAEQTAVGVDVIWTNWSNAFRTIDLTLSKPDDPVIAGITGPGAFTDSMPLYWHDSVSVRTGIEHTLENGFVLRSGYIYHPNPIPRATTSPFIQTTMQHAVSVGAGTTVCGWNVDLAYQFGFGDPTTVPSSAYVGGDFDGARFSTHAHWLLVELTRICR